MRNSYTRQRARHVPRENNSFWLTFSDLMSALLLVFILVMFYSVYQYFDMLELKTAELMRQSGLLDQKEEELNIKDEALQASQEKLTESEKALIAQQAQLLLTKQLQEEAEKTLAEQRKDLDDALALLDMREEDLATARALVDSQQARLDEQQERLDALVGVRARIVKSLADALANANVKAKVDEKTGAIALDASVLFDFGSSTLTESGKQVLDQFLPVYLGVLMQSENRDNISEIIIEGHTDSQGDYMTNMKLSEDRAHAVLAYILAPENTRIDLTTKKELRQKGAIIGRSYSNLIPDESGQEDAAASRRVEFKFRMQDEQMIQSMRDILSGMADTNQADLEP